MAGRRVLVTGGVRGIGRAIAEHLAAGGARVVVCGRSAPREVLPHGLRFLPCDVADAAAVTGLFEALQEEIGGLDILVNNAGLAGGNSLAPDADDEMWLAIVATCLHGTYFCSKAALPLLPDGTGRIVNIASILGLRGVPDQTAYCAAKHGVVGFTRSLALALAPRRITVNAICPGWVDTPMAAGRFRELGISPADAAAGAPTGRITSPEEVAAAVAYLCSPAAGNLTGQALVLDGGGLAGP